MGFGKDIRKSRIKQGYSLRKLAKLCDISPTYLSILENEKCVPSIDVCCRLANLLNWNDDLTILKAGHIPKWIQELIFNYPETIKKIFEALREDSCIAKLNYPTLKAGVEKS